MTETEVLEAIAHAMLDPDTDPALLPRLREMAANPAAVLEQLNTEEPAHAPSHQDAAT